jgi:hypothetical protein
MRAVASLSSLALVLLCLVALAACATGPTRIDRYRALSEPARDAYNKYYPFMTDWLLDRYLEAQSDAEREKIVYDMHVEERLALYSPAIRDAIWARQIVIGMDKAALFFAAGRPNYIEQLRSEGDKKTQEEEWTWDRGGEDLRVRLVDGVVTGVTRPRGSN